MIITKCEKCGELMHKADRCFFCGNTAGFGRVENTFTVHENVKDEYELLERLVKNEKYDEAIKLSKQVLEWMPSCSDVFWLRLLAKNRCNNDEALIRKGVDCESSADYQNALMFADETQRKVYTSVALKIATVKDVLCKYITEHEYSEKGSTSIVQYQSEYPTELAAYRTKLFELWKELKDIESYIAAVENDCLLLVNEHKETLVQASSDAAKIKVDVYKMEQCTEESLHKYQIQFGNLLHQSEQAKTAIDSMRRQHPWIDSYNTLVKKRDEVVAKINSEINSLKSYENRVRATVSEIEKIEARHSSAQVSVARYRFSEVRNLLGENLFTSAFSVAGLK